jgi:hypothetical protein
MVMIVINYQLSLRLIESRPRYKAFAREEDDGRKLDYKNDILIGQCTEEPAKNKVFIQNGTQ